MMIKKISEEPWSYTLYQEGSKYILSVLCGTSAMYETVIELNNKEVEEVHSGRTQELAALVRENTKKYTPRRIKGFSHPSSD